MTDTLHIYLHEKFCGTLTHMNQRYVFLYDPDYTGHAISLTMPKRIDPYIYNHLPPFFDGLLPEGYQLDGLLRLAKIDRYDYMKQLAQIGNDCVGAVTIKHPENISDTPSKDNHQ